MFVCQSSKFGKFHAVGTHCTKIAQILLVNFIIFCLPSVLQSRDEKSTFAQVREVTGAPDYVIEEAIKACRRADGSYKVEDVVTTIIADDCVSLGKSKVG